MESIKSMPFEVASELVLLKRELSFLVAYGYNDDYEGKQEERRQELRDKITAIEHEYGVRQWE